MFRFGNKPGKMMFRLARVKGNSTHIIALRSPSVEITSNPKQINYILGTSTRERGKTPGRKVWNSCQNCPYHQSQQLNWHP